MKKLASKFNRLSTAKKIEAIIAGVVSVSVMVATSVLAWFAHQTELAMLTKVNAPAKLYINAATHQEDIINLSLSDIDTEQTGIDYKEFVFCIAGDNVQAYNIQIAHTTNIPFNYEIYPATEIPQTGNTQITPVRGSIVQYTSEDKQTTLFYSYNSNNKIVGSYLNKDTSIEGRNVANNTYTITKTDEHQDYDKISDAPQMFAKALYWQNTSPIEVDLSDDNVHSFEHPYILKISWSQQGQDDEDAEDDAIDFVHNNKETDMVYITAEVN